MTPSRWVLERRATLLAGALLLAGCGGGAADHQDANAAMASGPTPVAPSPARAPSQASVAPASCRDEIGAAAAARLARQCRDASPATRPPCNVANSCAMMRDEIARSCDLFAGSDPLPPQLCAAASAAGAGPAATPATPAGVIRAYYAAIGARDYGRAYRLWGDDGRASGKTLAVFAKGFADTARTAVEIGEPSAPEGAAGSVYVTVPVTVRAVTGEGRRQVFTGDYVLRRVKNVPGATAAQRAWHIDSASLAVAR